MKLLEHDYDRGQPTEAQEVGGLMARPGQNAALLLDARETPLLQGKRMPSNLPHPSITRFAGRVPLKRAETSRKDFGNY